MCATDPILQIQTSQSLEGLEVRGPGNCEICSAQADEKAHDRSQNRQCAFEDSSNWLILRSAHVFCDINLWRVNLCLARRHRSQRRACCSRSL
jgi:hypothetical protein